MPESDYVQAIELTRQGRLDAFGQIVAAFQDMATGIAYGWLGDAELAREVSQEAFLDAFQHLDQLQTPAAFPGWFRQIVRKHCDRITRRKPPVTQWAADEAESVDHNDPAGIVENSEIHQAMRLTIESLPPAERLVIALHYFAELTGDEIGALLDMPLSTVKKRLRTARSRVRQYGETLMQETLAKLKPGHGEYTAEVMFFIAIRAGDHAAVKNMLAEKPELANALQNWDPELARQHLMPYPNKASALITAVELGDHDLLQILLGAGADPNGKCGCVTGEAPLWTAVLFNSPEHAQTLLKHGANPNVVSAVGNQPLHLAAMRGYSELVTLLLNHGAQPDALDNGSAWPVPSQIRRTPAEWAEHNGFPKVATMIRNHPEPVSTGDISGSVLQPKAAGEWVQTGIKSIDLFAPIQRGGLIRLPFAAGVGLIVLLGELSRRWVQSEGQSVIWTGFAQTPIDRIDLEADIAEIGLKGQIDLWMAPENCSEEEKQNHFMQSVAQTEKLRDEGQHVLLVMISADGYAHQIESIFPRILNPVPDTDGSITTMLISSMSEKQTWQSLNPPFTNQIALDVARARKYLFPAIHPANSFISTTAKQMLTPRHLALAEQVRTILTDYQADDHNLEKIQEMENTCAVRLLRYFAQPFFIAEPFTGAVGVSVSLDRMFDDIEQIIGN